MTPEQESNNILSKDLLVANMMLMKAQIWEKRVEQLYQAAVTERRKAQQILDDLEARLEKAND